MKHKKPIEKIIFVLIIVTITAAVFAACDETTDTNTQTTAAPLSVPETVTVQENEVMVRTQPDLPDINLGGYIFRVFSE